jgi:hypothetical protein
MKAIIRAKKPMDVRMYRMSAILRLVGKNWNVLMPEKCGDRDIAATTKFRERKRIGG